MDVNGTIELREFDHGYPGSDEIIVSVVRDGIGLGTYDGRPGNFKAYGRWSAGMYLASEDECMAFILDSWSETPMMEWDNDAQYWK